MQESYKVTHQMFFPISSPRVHLRQNKLCLREFWNTVIVYLSGSHTIRSAVMLTLQMTVSARSERRKCHPLRKYTIKDTFRCLITICSIWIAKRGFINSFLWTSNSTKFVFFFLPVAQNSPYAFTLFLPAWVPYNILKPRQSTKLS